MMTTTRRYALERLGIGILIAGGLIGLLYLIAKTKAKEIPPPVYTDPEQVINTTVNQEFIIALDSNPSTGYTWEASYDKSMLGLEKEWYIPKFPMPGPSLVPVPVVVGAGGTQYYQFKALKVGQTEITVTYKRSWETEYAEQKAFAVDIK